MGHLRFSYTIFQCHKKPKNCLITTFCPWYTIGYLWHKTVNCCKIDGFLMGFIFFILVLFGFGSFGYSCYKTVGMIQDGSLEETVPTVSSTNMTQGPIKVVTEPPLIHPIGNDEVGQITLPTKVKNDNDAVDDDSKNQKSQITWPNTILFFKTLFTDPYITTFKLPSGQPIIITWTYLPLLAITMIILIAVIVRWRVRHVTEIRTSNPLRDCFTACCCLQCALCQEMSEVENYHDFEICV